MSNSRQLAFLALKSVHKGAFADAALDKVLQGAIVSGVDRRLTTELVYGCARRMRSLDALIDLLAKKPASQQQQDMRTILHIGFYQLRYLSHIPESAAVNTTVQLAKDNGLAGLSGLANGLLRQYLRLGADAAEQMLAERSQTAVERLGILHSFPDWIVEAWQQQLLDWEQTEQLCAWMNQPPAIDLRINPLKTSVEAVEAAMLAAGIQVSRLPHLPQALRLNDRKGDAEGDTEAQTPNFKSAIQRLPGYSDGWWTVQDSSAQAAAYLLDPQPGEVIIDACAAPGGKTAHIAELMGDRGTIWACDRAASRLRQARANFERLQLQSIRVQTADSRNLTEFTNLADRVLLDAPCSGLGTLHRRADARWRQTPAKAQELALQQQELLDQVATWVKPGGILVYATCTLHQPENEDAIANFLQHHPQWQLNPPPPESPAAAFISPAGWIKIWPHQQHMDGFFMARLQRDSER